MEYLPPSHFLLLNFPFTKRFLFISHSKSQVLTPKGETWPKDLVKRLLVTFYQSQPQAAELLTSTTYASPKPGLQSGCLPPQQVGNSGGRNVQSLFPFIQNYNARGPAVPSIWKCHTNFCTRNWSSCWKVSPLSCTQKILAFTVSKTNVNKKDLALWVFFPSQDNRILSIVSERHSQILSSSESLQCHSQLLFKAVY